MSPTTWSSTSSRMQWRPKNPRKPRWTLEPWSRSWRTTRLESRQEKLVSASWMKVTYKKALRLTEHTLWMFQLASASVKLGNSCIATGSLEEGFNCSPTPSTCPAKWTWSQSALSCVTTLGVCASVPWPWRGTSTSVRPLRLRTRCTIRRCPSYRSSLKMKGEGGGQDPDVWAELCGGDEKGEEGVEVCYGGDLI